MPSRMIILRGTLPKLKPEDAARLAVYLVRGSEILSQSSAPTEGDVRFHLSREVIAKSKGQGFQLVVGPADMKNLEQVPRLQRVPLNPETLEKGEAEVRVPLSELDLSEEVLKVWWPWCRWYCLNGSVIGPTGCPVPGAQVTVYSVAYTSGGYVKTPRATVVTNANGQFTACFWWCTYGYCWPCWPFWWWCWPWWWEWDILHVLEQIERMAPQLQATQALQLPGKQARVPLAQPDSRALMRGEGFAAARKAETNFAPDAARTALIERKLVDPRIRVIFPWWWWCCDDPNIVFSVTQGANTIVDEDPATDTRWCFEDGSTVTLVGNQQTISACPPPPPPLQGFEWTRVGNITVNNITGGYANGNPVSDASDMAFAGTLDIYGEFALGTPVAYFQVLAGQWLGDPSRGGTAPAASTPISADLWNTVFIVHPVGPATVANVKMGPFNQGGLTNLYATQDARQNGPTPPGLAPFPTVAPGDFAVWAFNGRKVYSNASSLIGGGSVGGVDLTLVGYNNTLAPVSLVPDAPLTLEIDNLPLTTQQINSLTPYRSTGTLASGTGGACPAYDLGVGGYVVLNVSVSDANGHLYEYLIEPDYGSGSVGTASPAYRGYRQSPASFPPSPPYGRPDTTQKSFVGGTDNFTFYPPTDCCYDFRLNVGKRVTDGQSFFCTWYTATFQTATLKVT